jgi:hypothetical protein
MGFRAPIRRSKCNLMGYTFLPSRREAKRPSSPLAAETGQTKV